MTFVSLTRATFLGKARKQTGSWGDLKFYQILEKCHESVKKHENGKIPKNVVHYLCSGDPDEQSAKQPEIDRSLALLV